MTLNWKQNLKIGKPNFSLHASYPTISYTSLSVSIIQLHLKIACFLAHKHIWISHQVWSFCVFLLKYPFTHTHWSAAWRKYKRGGRERSKIGQKVLLAKLPIRFFLFFIEFNGWEECLRAKLLIPWVVPLNIGWNRFVTVWTAYCEPAKQNYMLFLLFIVLYLSLQYSEKVLICLKPFFMLLYLNDTVKITVEVFLY